MRLLGILCFIYYGMIVLTLKRWNSTFSRFWLVAGTGFLFLDFVKNQYPDSSIFINTGIGICMLAISVVEVPIMKAMIPEKEKDIQYLIILGAKVMKTTVTDSLRRRLDKAVQYLQENHQTVIIVSGGQGNEEDITEAEAMRRYLLQKGISPERIFKEDASRNTEENLEFSKEFIKNMDVPVGIVSNNFHMYRACCYAKRAGYKNVKRIPAGCHLVLFPNYMFREFFAVLKLWILRLIRRNRS